MISDTIRRHRKGEITIGLYAINPAVLCSKWVAIDVDYEDALADRLPISARMALNVYTSFFQIGSKERLAF